MPLAADANIDPFPRLLHAYWRYICVWIPVSSIYMSISLGMSLIFSKYAYLFGGLFFVKCVLIFT